MERQDIFTDLVFDNNQALVDEIEKIFKINGSGSSVFSMRVLELIVEMATISRNHLTLICEQKFALNDKIKFYLDEKQNDPLAKLNCIELLNPLVCTPHGFAFLEKHLHLKHLLQEITTPSTEPEQQLKRSLISPAIYTLFFQMASTRPTNETLQLFPTYFEQLFANVCEENIDNELVIVSLETFATLFQSNHTKQELFKSNQPSMSKFFTRLCWMLEFCINESIKSACLKCSALLFAPDTSLLKPDTLKSDEKLVESAWLTTEWIDLSRMFYNQIIEKTRGGHDKLFNLVLQMAKQTASSTLRFSAHLYFKALVQTKWGLQRLFSSETEANTDIYQKFVLDYLLNRSVEGEKEGLESKYELIKMLECQFKLHTDLIYLIGEGTEGMPKLRKYLKDGPFYTESKLNVAFESN